jgi:hypothetical protein
MGLSPDFVCPNGLRAYEPLVRSQAIHRRRSGRTPTGSSAILTFPGTAL